SCCRLCISFFQLIRIRVVHRGQRHQQVSLISDVLLQCFLFVCFQKLTVFVFYLLFKCQTAVEDLQEKLERLRALADGLERVHEGATIGSLTGGVIGAVGGITSIVGLVLAPFTLGASLIVTGVGVGVGVAGGVTAGASNITNMVNQSSDRKAVRIIIKEIEQKICAVVTVANIGQLAAQTSRAVRVAEVATGVLSGLFVAVDIFFIAMDAKEIHHIKEAREAERRIEPPSAPESETRLLYLIYVIVYEKKNPLLCHCLP
uniref:Uncharacterized protein n=1 Tax=Poecilia mexicana TaxID=48701 RepID=A0A3B3WNB6_9TELE